MSALPAPSDAAPPDASGAPPPPRSFERTLRVVPDDLDPRALVDQVAYVRWVQDTAIAHWEAVTSPAIRADLGWVLTRHEIDYLAPASPGDALVVRTTVGSAERLLFERHTIVRRAADGRVLARSRSMWCPVDPATGRPRRMTPPVRALFAAMRAADPDPDVGG